MGGHLHVVKYLIEKQHCDPRHLDKNGWTPLHCAIGASEENRMKVVKYLIETCHCDPKCVSKIGWTPLHWASS